MKEIELYPYLKNHFAQLGYKVYAEVLVKESSRYVDAVAIDEKNERIITFELKTSYNQEVIKQALFNANIFHQSYVVIPKPKKKINFKLHNYVGIILVDLENKSIEIIHQPKSVAFLPSFKQMTERLYLNSVNSWVLAGEEITKNHLTAKQITKAKIINILQAQPVISMEALEKQVDSHFKHHKQGLITLCRESPELEVFEENGVKYLRLKIEKTT